VVVFEAFTSANYWAREMKMLKHDVRLIAPQYVKPFVKRRSGVAVASRERFAGPVGHRDNFHRNTTAAALEPLAARGTRLSTH
jgi:hypothetical protein